MICRFGMNGTKWNIFEQAVHLFAQKGYTSVSIRDIAKVAEIKASTIYHYFASKEEILLTIYEYYDHYFIRKAPKLAKLLEEVETLPPKEVLMKLVKTADTDEMEVFMHKLLIIVSIQMFDDARAKEIIDRTMFELPRQFFTPIFEKMIELDKIEPFDIESYLLIHSSLCYSVSVAGKGVEPVSWEEWERCHSFFIDHVIKVKQK